MRKKMLSLHGLLLIFIVFILFTGCVGNTPPKIAYTSTEGSSPFESTPEGQTTKIAPAISKTDTPLPTSQLINLSDLSSGDYIVIWQQISKDGLSFNNYVALVSTFGEHMGYWLDSGIFTNVYISQDGYKFSFENPNPGSSYFLDVRSNQTTKLKSFDGCGSASWSPDGQVLVAICEDESENFNSNLFLFQGGTRSRLADCSPEQCTQPTWSTQGDWIAFTRTKESAGERTKTEGLYLLSTKCLSSQNSCPTLSLGPFQGSGPITWSPDGHFLALRNSGLLIYEIEGMDVKLFQEFDTTTYVDSLAWSPDGNWIAYNNGNDIFLLSPNDGRSKLVTALESADLKILGWESIP